MNDITDYVCNLVNGNFINIDPRKIVLSEAFAPKEDGIAHKRKIPPKI